jgi:hypothetical protein
VAWSILRTGYERKRHRPQRLFDTIQIDGSVLFTLIEWVKLPKKSIVFQPLVNFRER